MANWGFDKYDAYFELREETTDPYVGDRSGLIDKTDDPGSRLIWKYDSPKTA